MPLTGEIWRRPLPRQPRALTRLQALDPRQAKIVELRYFAGLKVEETAEALDVSPATVKREWKMARLWLRAEIEG